MIYSQRDQRNEKKTIRKTRHSLRTVLPVILAILCFVQVISVAACAAQTPDQAPEGKFIQNLGDKSAGILVDTSLTPTQLDVKYREMMDRSFDIHAINEYVIGRTWQRATPAQQQEYMQLFKKLVLRTYGGHLRFHTGENFHVTGINPPSAEDTVVSTEITHPDGIAPTPVDWIVRRKSDGRLAVVDVVVNGVSQNATQRDEFASLLASNGGDFSMLLNALRQKVHRSSSND